MKVEDLKITKFEHPELIETIKAEGHQFNVRYSTATGLFTTFSYGESPERIEAPSIAELRQMVAHRFPERMVSEGALAAKVLVEICSYKGVKYEFFYDPKSRMFEVTMPNGDRWSDPSLNDLIKAVEKELGIG